MSQPYLDSMDKIIESAKEVANDLGQTGKEIIKTSATFIGPVAVVGLVAFGFKKMLDGFKKD